MELLFDLESDPGELKNLAAPPTLSSELDRHRQLLAEWKKTTEEDKHPVKATPGKPKRKVKRSRV